MCVCWRECTNVVCCFCVKFSELTPERNWCYLAIWQDNSSGRTQHILLYAPLSFIQHPLHHHLPPNLASLQLTVNYHTQANDPCWITDDKIKVCSQMAITWQTWKEETLVERPCNDKIKENNIHTYIHRCMLILSFLYHSVLLSQHHQENKTEVSRFTPLWSWNKSLNYAASTDILQWG